MRVHEKVVAKYGFQTKITKLLGNLAGTLESPTAIVAWSSHSPAKQDFFQILQG